MCLQESLLYEAEALLQNRDGKLIRRELGTDMVESKQSSLGLVGFHFF